MLPVRSQFFELKRGVKFSFITFFINIEHVHGIKIKKREGECETAAALTIFILNVWQSKKHFTCVAMWVVKLKLFFMNLFL